MCKNLGKRRADISIRHTETLGITKIFFEFIRNKFASQKNKTIFLIKFWKLGSQRKEKDHRIEYFLQIIKDLEK